ncbi:MAG: hypothetical protein ACR2NB_14685 [Solirubrobacteraceae bacterium]
MDALPPEVIDSLVDSAPFASEHLREKTRIALKGRVAWMGDLASGKSSSRRSSRRRSP